MAPHTEYSEPEVVEDAQLDSNEGLDAAQEDKQTTTGNEQQQAQNELNNGLDTNNIIDNSAGVSTRGAKPDVNKQDREIDQAVDSAEQVDQSS
ncbi:unnamed protein product [Jaminaea pallidilutea]